MDLSYAGYLEARGLVSSFAPFLLAGIFISGVLLAVSSVFYLKNRGKTEILNRLLLFNAVLLSLGFLLLLWFHFEIYRLVEIRYPQFFHFPASRFLVPLWIEREKLYFWTFSLSLLALVLARRGYPGVLLAGTAVSISLFEFAVVFFSDPFSEPLPRVHSEITAWFSPTSPHEILGLAPRLFARINYYYNSTYMWTHPPMLFLAYTFLVVTFIASILDLTTKRGGLEEAAYDSARVGYILLTLGMLVGYPWAVEAWKGESWWWDPKINTSIMLWSLYTAYLHTRLYPRLRKTTAIIGILAFLALIFTFLASYLIPGIHSIAQP